MAVISGGRFARGVQKALGIKGETTIPDLDSALQADFDILDASSDPAHTDLHSLFGWNRFFRAFDITGDATHVGSASFAMVAPLNGGIVIAVVERWIAWVPVADMACQLAFEGPPGAPSQALQPFDSRAAKKSLATLNTSAIRNPGGQLIGNVPASSQGATLALVEIVAPGQPGMVALGGDAWTCYTLNATARIFGGVWWRERAIDPSELTT